ncbi:MAG: Fe-S cluster assembly sulfur transfer protein SufU [Nocardioides sp.]
MDLDALYQQIVLDHYRHPLHAGLREPFDAQVHHVNPTCGDEITMRVRIGPGDTMADVSYHAQGCAISQASASVMADLLIGRTVAVGMVLCGEFLGLMHGRGTVVPDEDRLGDGVAFAGVATFPSRVKCALLPWMAWKDATSTAVADDAKENQNA